jgi:hypothetical protein
MISNQLFSDRLESGKTHNLHVIMPVLYGDKCSTTLCYLTFDVGKGLVKGPGCESGPGCRSVYGVIDARCSRD